MSAKTDLHLHTFYSDGADSPEDVIKRAAGLGFDFAAICDHDGVGGISEAQAAGEKYDVKVISGTEISAAYEVKLPGFSENKYFMHILGLGIDKNYGPLIKSLKSLSEKRRARNDEIIKAFAKKGIDIEAEELLSVSPRGFVGKSTFAKVFVKKGLCAGISEAFKSPRLLGDIDIRAIRKDKIQAEEAISLIKGAGGLAFLAHPFQLSYIGKREDSFELFCEKLTLIVPKLKEMGLCGVEAYYPTHGRRETDFLLNLAKKNGLAVSRGSDDHGAGVRPVKTMGPFCCDMGPTEEAATRKLFTGAKGLETRGE